MKYTLEHAETGERLNEKYEILSEACEQSNKIFEHTGIMYLVVADTITATPYTDTATDATKVVHTLNTIGLPVYLSGGVNIRVNRDEYTPEIGILLQAAGYSFTGAA